MYRAITLKTKFQDEDFELGEVVDAVIRFFDKGKVQVKCTAKAGGEHVFFYDGLEELFDDFDMEEQ